MAKGIPKDCRTCPDVEMCYGDVVEISKVAEMEMDAERRGQRADFEETIIETVFYHHRKAVN